jgi:lipopolysaccharide export system protein LptA
MLSTRRSRYLGAFAVATVAAAAGQETSPDVSVEADSVFFDARGNSVFSDLSVSDGTVSIRAREGVATRSELEAGTWQFKGEVEITFATAMLLADSATFRFAAGRLIEGEVLGRPAAFEASPAEGRMPFSGTAGFISYDRSRGLLTAREGATFAYDDTQVRNCNWTYSLSDGAFSGFANDDDKCVVSIAVADEEP